MTRPAVPYGAEAELLIGGLPIKLPPAPDLVNHPPHYNAHPSGVECITVTEHMNFCLGSAMKYLWRAGQKGAYADHIRDLEKAGWYIDREIKRRKEIYGDGDNPGGRVGLPEKP